MTILPTMSSVGRSIATVIAIRLLQDASGMTALIVSMAVSLILCQTIPEMPSLFSIRQRIRRIILYNAGVVALLVIVAHFSSDLRMSRLGIIAGGLIATGICISLLRNHQPTDSVSPGPQRAS